MMPAADPRFAEIPRGFRDVDAHAGAEQFSSYLQRLAAMLKAQKESTYELLNAAAGQRLLDVGCGRGDDVRALAQRVAPTGEVVGIDRSSQMIAEACKSGVPDGVAFWVANGHELPFEDHRFHAARVERTLQHVDDPPAVLAEMVRVLLPGGILVASEPDWGTATIDSADRATTRVLLRELCDRHIRHGWVGRQLAGHFSRLGLHDVEVYPTTLVIRSLDAAFDVLGLGTADGVPATWLSDLRMRDAHHSFFASVTGFTVRGRKP